jgi:hypothetical protein
MDNTDLQLLLTNAGFEVRSYSGRGMNGKTCLAVVVDREDNAAAMFAELLALTSSHDGSSTDTLAVMEVIQEALRDHRTESMGRDTVVYWPNVSYDPNATGG